MIFHANSQLRQCIESPDGEPPEGWVILYGQEARDAWAASLPPVLPPPITYSRADYKRAIDAVLLREANSFEFDNIESGTSYTVRPGKYQEVSIWLYDLRTFMWATSDEMAKSPPAGDPPTPEQLAAYLFTLFVTQHPKPEAP